MKDHLASVRKLEANIKQTLAVHGFQLLEFKLITDDNHEDTVSIKVAIDKSLLKTVTELETDKAFEKIMEAES